jgi:CheY-like chemotaxis protein
LVFLICDWRRSAITSSSTHTVRHAQHRARCLTQDQPVDLVFTDLIMPGGMSGREVAVRARQLKPGIKVLLTSGYAEELVHGSDLERAQLKVLRKPYQHSDLVATLREVLSRDASQT